MKKVKLLDRDHQSYFGISPLDYGVKLIWQLVNIEFFISKPECLLVYAPFIPLGFMDE